jgi:hypothetical protein
VAGIGRQFLTMSDQWRNDTHEVVEKPDFLREFANQSVQCALCNLLQIYEAGEN